MMRIREENGAALVEFALILPVLLLILLGIIEFGIILYDKAIRTAYASLFDPRAKTVTIGTGEQSKSGSIESVLLFDGKVECLSCHDAHNTFTVGPLRLLKNPADGRAICLSCHVK